ncbi:MAG: octaprenyl-diphosphate synthase [Thermotogaceae bacterium]|jgi:octaprenyl-diphosphate synthase|nr:octaprenyl-diphosphate synthase [Thermotogaceae bacterium]MDN5338787.1 octaprenyl-diphosphate synthase [Thermotogaceae bacterium]
MEANTLNPNFCENELKKIKANLRKIFKAVGLENISPGKLLRPRLGLLVAQKLKLVDDITNELTAVELIHNASLFHDDVIDEATVRRNSPSLNFLKGSKFSILYGDLLILNATRLILDSKNREIFELYVKTVENMIMGELIEISNTNNLKLDFQQYMDIIRKKSGSLFGLSAAIPAIVCKEDYEFFYDIGVEIGAEYQKMDDLFDFVKDSRELGKDSLKDIENGVVSFPVILLKNEIGEEKLEGILQEKDFRRLKIIFKERCEKLAVSDIKDNVLKIAEEHPWLFEFLNSMFSKILQYNL